MDRLSIAIWGGFIAIMAVLTLVALHVHRRHWLRAARQSASANLAVLVYQFMNLGWLDWLLPGAPARLYLIGLYTLAASAGMLWYFMIGTGYLREHRLGLPARAALVLAFAAAALTGLFADAQTTLLIESTVAAGAGLLAAALSLLHSHENRPWFKMLLPACLAMVLAVVFGVWINLHHPPWPVHLAAALSSLLACGLIALVVWNSFSYMLELSNTLRWGRNFDPVSRSPALPDLIARMLPDASQRQRNPCVVGAIAVHLDNLADLERRHGRESLNLCVYVVTARIRRALGNICMMGYFDHQTYVALMHRASDPQELERLLQHLRHALTKPVALVMRNASLPLMATQPDQTLPWLPDFGIGVWVGPLWDLQERALQMRLQHKAREARNQPDRTVQIGPDDLPRADAGATGAPAVAPEFLPDAPPS